METQPDSIKNSSIGGRTFCVRTPEAQGTAFTMDIDGRRYLITAQHVFGPNSTGLSIETKSGQKPIDVEVVGFSAPELDVTVLRPSVPVHDHCFRTYPQDENTRGIVIGEDVYSFGFPMGLATRTFRYRNFPYPTPLLRRCMVSGFGLGQYFLDGTVNPGHSGGPVFRMQGTVPIVIGLVSQRSIEVADVTVDDLPTALKTTHNAGIVTVSGIELAMGIIRSKPIGLEVGGPNPVRRFSIGASDLNAMQSGGPTKSST